MAPCDKATVRNTSKKNKQRTHQHRVQNNVFQHGELKTVFSNRLQPKFWELLLSLEPDLCILTKYAVD